MTASDWRRAVTDFERAMFARARPMARECSEGFARMFGTDGAQEALDHLQA